MLEALVAGFVTVFTFPTFPLMLVGIFIGFWVGILPGLGSPVTMALMLPFIFQMKPAAAFAFLLGMYAVTSTTGDITSILFGVPGEATTAATILDGHPMAKKGEAGRALGAALMSSLVGASLSAFVLAASIPIVTPIVLSFASPEFFALALLGITFVAALSGHSKLKGVLAGGLGITLAMVGLDPQENVERYTFGLVNLWEGLGLVPVAVGLFAIPEIVDMWVVGTSISQTKVGKLGGVWQGTKDTFIHFWLVVRCSMMGTFVGIIPGLGASVGQWVAYAHAVQSSKDKSQFGKGDVRGVLGPGAANNCSVAGGLIPTLAFGVPGNLVLAILLGAFMIQGIQPGPKMLTENLDLTFSMVWVIIVSNVITVAICYAFLEQLARMTEMRVTLLMAPLILLVLLGGYADTNSYLAMAITFIFGVIGMVMVRLEWPRPPLVLGMVLGPMMERNLFISHRLYEFGFLLRPIVLVIILIGALALFLPVLEGLFTKRLAAAGVGIREADIVSEED